MSTAPSREQNIKNVTRWRVRVKQKIVDICGGKCNHCGYDKCVAALEFHHLDPSSKDFTISCGGRTPSFSKLVDEARKCVMLCSNCHREVHNDLLDVENISRIFNENLAEQYQIDIEASKRSKRVFNAPMKKQKECCVECGKERKNNRLYCSFNCVVLARNKHQDEIDYVFELYERLNNFEEVGRQLNLTGAAIKRRLKLAGKI